MMSRFVSDKDSIMWACASDRDFSIRRSVAERDWSTFSLIEKIDF